MVKEVPSKVVNQFKDRMRITHKSEDDNLKRLLSFSIANLQQKCGDFDIEDDEMAKELVFERTRYVYNDAAEYFDTNFLSEINALSFKLLEREDDERVQVQSAACPQRTTENACSLLRKRF